LGLALGGCDRTHMSPHFGVADREAFHAQVIHPDAGNVAKPDQPLDPEEAAVISHTYLKSLVPPNATSDQSQSQSRILVVPPPQPGVSAMPPAPVPSR
jgi:hypothetical protein